MMRIIAFGVLLVLVAAPAAAQVQVDAGMVGNGPYYLDQAGATYTLTEDVTVPGTAFVFAATNVTLDLNGHTVTFGEVANMYRYGVVVPPPYPHVAPRWTHSDITRWTGATGAVIRNGRIVQGAGRADSCFALAARNQNDLTIRDNTIVIYGGDTFAILTESCNAVVVYGNEITDHTTKVTNRHQGRASIDLVDAATGPIEVFNNTINGCRHWGIRVSRGANPSTEMAHIYDNDIFPNTIATNGYGIGIHGDNIEAFGNTIVSENGRGIHVDGVNALVHNNYIEVEEEPTWEEYTRTSAHGIKLERCRNAEVYSNTVISKGIAEDMDAVGNGAALSLTIETGSNAYVHDNTFISRHLGGAVFDPNNYGFYAAPFEVVEIDDGSGLRFENNILQSNDRFISLQGWANSTGTGIADASDVIFSGNTFRRDTETPFTGREPILLQSSSIEDLRFTDCTFEDGVDLRAYEDGWPWKYCSWSRSWSGVVRVLDESGFGVGGVPVEVRNHAGTVVATGVSDGAGNVPVVLDEYTVSTVGANLEHIADTLYANPYEITAILATGPVSQTWTAQTPYFVVNLATDGSGGGVVSAPPVEDIDWAFHVLTTSPAPGTAGVAPGAELRCLFSHAVDGSSLAGAIQVTGSQSGLVPGSWSLVMGDRLVLYRPDTPLATGETVEVQVSGGVRSAQGRTLDGNEDGIAGGAGLDDYLFQFVVGNAGGD